MADGTTYFRPKTDREGNIVTEVIKCPITVPATGATGKITITYDATASPIAAGLADEGRYNSEAPWPFMIVRGYRVDGLTVNANFHYSDRLGDWAAEDTYLETNNSNQVIGMPTFSIVKDLVETPLKSKRLYNWGIYNVSSRQLETHMYDAEKVTGTAGLTDGTLYLEVIPGVIADQFH